MHTLTRLACAVLLTSVCAAPGVAQDLAPLRLSPEPGGIYGFVLDRRTTVYRGPGRTFDEPRKRQVASTLRVQPLATETPGHVVLAVTFLRVNGFETGETPTDIITFDRRVGDPPSGRPETLIVGTMIEVEAERDGTLVAVRGVDEAMPGNLVTATAAIADLRALVALLPATEAGTWTTNTLEGRGLLRASISATHEIEHTTDAESRITVTGEIAAAPEGAGESFEKLFRVSKGKRTARYRISRNDGLPIEGRVATAYAVEARLPGSNMEVGVDTETVVSVRRTDTTKVPGTSTPALPAAPTPGDRTPNEGLPGWIGTSQDVLRRLAGAPTKTGEGLTGGKFDTFGSFGLVYEYDDDGFARRVTASHFSGGESFGGKVLGVKLGDTLATAAALWGEPQSHRFSSTKLICRITREPSSRRETSSEFEAIVFAFDTMLIELEIWRQDGEDPAFGKYAASTVKRIRVTGR